MFDLHSHILSALDDGNGTKGIVATLHAIEDYGDEVNKFNNKERLANIFNENTC